MKTESRAVVMLGCFIFLIGAIVGMIAINSQFKHDTYDCTVKCPDNAHSIEVDQTCFCEVK